jgi:hypothetical protein
LLISEVKLASALAQASEYISQEIKSLSQLTTPVPSAERHG